MTFFLDPLFKYQKYDSRYSPPERAKTLYLKSWRYRKKYGISILWFRAFDGKLSNASALSVGKVLMPFLRLL